MRHPIENFLTEFNQYPVAVQKDLAPGKLPGFMNNLRVFCFRSEKLTKELLAINADLTTILSDYSKQKVSIEKCLSKISDALDFACRARKTAFLINHVRLPEDLRLEKGRFEDHVIRGLIALKEQTDRTIYASEIEGLIIKAKYPKFEYDLHLLPLNPNDVELKSTNQGPQQ